MKHEIQTFWGEVYRAAYLESDSMLTGDGLRDGLDRLEDMFRRRRHLAVTEMGLADLTGKRVLEIGSGAGAHSALFAKAGARVIGIDITPDRARATGDKLALMAGSASDCAALQSDAESLPFADDCFDIVYSNGVLHHTPDTEAAIAEALRVLRPGGRAVVMLYCKSSISYWVTLWLGYGILRGGLLKGRDRLGARTEWAGARPQTVENPITRCYTAGEIRRLFSSFVDVGLRKSEFSIAHLPKIGKPYRRWQERRYGLHPGGMLVYGAPWPIASPFENWLGRYAGWAWNIVATKPAPGSGSA